VYFAGTINQGAGGLKKYGAPSNSGAVQGYRYNARVLAAHIAEKHFGHVIERPMLRPDVVVDYLLEEATRAPELWNQRSYLARAISFERGGIRDAGIVPLAAFVDSDGGDAIAITVETDPAGEIHPAVYLRTSGQVREQLLESDPLHDFRSPSNRRALVSLLGSLV
jgi:hypothetical protein